MPIKRKLVDFSGEDEGFRCSDRDNHDRSRHETRARSPSDHNKKRPQGKIQRTDRDILSTLSDELLIRILSYLDETTLLTASPTSRRFCRITSDSQLWRPHYYTRFILPRAHRIPGFRAGLKRTSSKLRYSAGKAIWADGGWGRRGGIVPRASESVNAAPQDRVDWKKQYKLRHNWARGRCAVQEVQVRDGDGNATVPECRTMVKVVEGLAITVDRVFGLRVWDLKSRRLVAQAGLVSDGLIGQHSCVAADNSLLPNSRLDVAVGFEDGSFGIWQLDMKKLKLSMLYRHEETYFGGLVAVAYSHPYILTASKMGFIALYSFQQEVAKLVTSLKSHSTRLPLALSIRRAASSVIASIAYTFDAVNGWCIGIQDLDIKTSGVAMQADIVTSRLAYTLPATARASTATSSQSILSRSSLGSVPTMRDGPIRLCYSHPYLLATLPDNTLVLHLCTSTNASLSISPGIRLWGHTSGISDAQITPQGKAVSVSTRGHEIRVWELEGRIGGSSVELRPRRPSHDLQQHAHAKEKEAGTSRLAVNTDDRKNWVGFDDEMVVVLKEAVDGRESLMVYDFT